MHFIESTAFIPWLIFHIIVGGVIGAVINVKKGHNGLVGFLGGALLGVFLVWLFLLQKDSKKGLGLKKCPFCAEYVKREATVCKHCGKDLPLPSPAGVRQSP